MRYEEAQPAPRLRPWVRCYWLLEGATPVPPDGVLPDGCPEIVLNFGEPFRRLDPDTGTATAQPTAMIVGQITGPIVVGGTGRVDLLGVRLTPVGARALLGGDGARGGSGSRGGGGARGGGGKGGTGGMPLSALTDGFAPLDGVTTGWEAARERLGQTDSASCRIPLLERFLESRLPTEAPGRGDPVAAAVDLLWRSHGAASIDDVARAVGLGPRQLRRRFVDEVGVGPKTLAGIRRFQRFLALAPGSVDGGGEPTLARAAVAAGYFDQAHLTRDFRRLAGTTPGAFLAGRPGLADLFAEVDLRRAATRPTPGDSRSPDVPRRT